MSFNVDDPLAGILSDGSDDSFFDDDIIGKKSSSKPKVNPTTEKKQALFNLDAEEKPKTPVPTRKLEKLDSFKDSNDDRPKTPFTQRKAPSPAPLKRNISKESISFLDITDKESTQKANVPVAKPKNPFEGEKTEKGDRLVESKKDLKPLQKGKSSQSLFDDILGADSTTTKPIFKQPSRTTLNTAKTQEFDLDSFLGKNDSIKPKTPVAPKDAKLNKLPTKPDNKDNAAVKKTSSSSDWLGLFQDKNDDEVEDDAGMPSWLVGADAKKKPVEDSNKPKPQKELTAEPITEKESNKKEDESFKIETVLEVKDDTFGIKGVSDSATVQGAALCLQEQESQLMIALQLKSQEEKLAAIQMRHEESAKVQRESAKASREQVEALLQRQAEQRQQMQAIIAAHQSRITERIKALLGPPKADYETNDDHDQEYQSPASSNEPPHKKETKQLLQLVQSLQENHEKEIDLMETSYRRQLAFLELSMNQTEERMKDEGEKVTKYYSEKIHWLEEHHNSYKKLAEENIVAVIERNKAENEMLRQQHLENVKVLQEHHANLMENIRSAVKQEQHLIQDSTGFSSNILELLKDVKESKSSCQQLVERVQAIAETSQRDTEKSLDSRDSQLNDMMQHLKRERENFESEKNENREIIKSLEARLKQMTAMIEEESAVLKQRRMEFEFEKATFNKQTEYAKNVIKRQDDEIKTIREEIDKEHRDSKARLEDEAAKAQRDSLAVAKEKIAVQNLRQDLEKIKAELHLQLEEVSEERSRLNIEKQQIHMEQQRVFAKSRDLDLLAKTAIEKQSQADTKYTEAEAIQRKYEDRIRRIQEHVVSLNNREKHIAREKVALSRERLTIHNEKKQIQGTQCSLCKTSQNLPLHPPAYTLPESFANIHVSRDYGTYDPSRTLNTHDPGRTLNSYDPGRTLNTDDPGRTLNAIENEVAKLMGSNHGGRHGEGLDVDVSLNDDLPQPGLQNVDVYMNDVSLKDYMDPKLMLLRLDVQKVLSNLDQSKNVADNVNKDKDDVTEERG